MESWNSDRDPWLLHFTWGFLSSSTCLSSIIKVERFLFVGSPYQRAQRRVMELLGTFCYVVSGQLKPTFVSVSRTEGTDSIQLGLTLNIGCALSCEGGRGPCIYHNNQDHQPPLISSHMECGVGLPLRYCCWYNMRMLSKSSLSK